MSIFISAQHEIILDHHLQTRIRRIHLHVRADRGSDSRPDGPARAAVHQRKTKQTQFANSGNLTRDTVKPTERTWPALDDETNRRIFKITRTGTSPGSLGYRATANRLRVLWVTTTLALEDTLGHRTTANRSRVLWVTTTLALEDTSTTAKTKPKDIER